MSHVRPGPAAAPATAPARPPAAGLAGTIAYLLLGLPLGVIALTLVVTGLALGAGLAITLLGLPILLATVWAARALMDVERRLANALLGAQLPPPAAAPPRPPATAGAPRWSQRLTAPLRDRATLQALAYLRLLRLPLGVAGFTTAVVAVSVPLAYLSAPWSSSWTDLYLWSGRVDRPAEAWVAVAVGVVLGVGAVAVLRAAHRLSVATVAAFTEAAR